MYNAHATRAAASVATSPIRRLGQRSFWLLFVIEGCFVAGMLLLALYILLPARAPLAQSGDYAAVRAAVQSRLSGAVADPLVEVAPGTSARLSSAGGFTLNGYTYYYYREGQASFDPLSRGTLARSQVELVSRERIGGDMVVIYRLPSKDRATN